MNHGRTIFSQVVELLPRKAFDLAVTRYGGQNHVRSFSCMDQLLCMIFAQLTCRSSLRETVLCLRAMGPRRYHCGIRGNVAKSTLADANERRGYRIFQDLALTMIRRARIVLPVDGDLARLQAEVFALDSTTIDLCLKLFPWAVFRRKKAAVKAHVLFDVLTGIPVFMHISHGKRHDLWMLDQFVPVVGAFYVMDRGYVDFERLYRMHTARAFFITRAKRKMNFGVRHHLAVPPDGPVKSDRLIRLRIPQSRKDYPEPLRLVHYLDPETGRRLRFLTNNFSLDALTIALLYRKRWQIELFFKWIKQHLHILAFFGTTPNAVCSQLWIAVIVYVLVAELKHQHQLPQSLNEISQILSVTILQKTPVNVLFSQKQWRNQTVENRNQLGLFEL
ncbi:MAG: IS4 family transposase [Phycisphaerales bacterium]|nr:IS4 family transposase [Phycisphaerales bacterium]